MGCGISAAVSGIDWYLIEENSSKSARPTERTTCVSVKLPNERSSSVQLPDVEINSHEDPQNNEKSSSVQPPDVKIDSYEDPQNNESSSNIQPPDDKINTKKDPQNISISGVYQIKREEATHTLVLLEDGRIVIDGNFAQSVIYRQGRTDLSFTMLSNENLSGSLVSGNISFTDSNTLNGTFNFNDNESLQNVAGVKDEAGEVDSISDTGEGKQTVVIDESTFKKVKELERKLESYQTTDLYSSISVQTRIAEQLEDKIIKQLWEIEEHILKLDKEKQEHGADSEQCRELEIELESKCLALSADQEHYDNTLQYIRTRTADLFDYNMLTEQFDDLLNVMFRGESGNDIENQLEEMLDQAEDSERKHATSFHIEERIWENVKAINEKLLLALNKWSSLESKGYTGEQRESLVKQTRVLIVQTIDELVALETILKQYEDYESEDQCIVKLIQFRENISKEENLQKVLKMTTDNPDQMFEGSEGVGDGVDTIMFCQTCTRRIEQWVYEKFRIKEGQEKLTSLQKLVFEAKMKLKQERRNLIESWLTEHVGSFERENTVISTKSDEIPDKITVQSNNQSNGNHVQTNDVDQSSAPVEETKSEVGMVESYTQIAARVQAWEKKSDLDGIRAELELQDKMRARRRRQRHQRAQKLIEVQSPAVPAAV